MKKLTLSLLLTVFVAMCGTGCIRTAVKITSSPTDATVKVNYVERGRTPIDIPIIWYWYYKVQVEKDGYRPIETDERFWAPFWAVPPLDLVAEALPFPLKKTYYRHYVMEPETE